jgi:hypothetical protein
MGITWNKIKKLFDLEHKRLSEDYSSIRQPIHGVGNVQQVHSGHGMNVTMRQRGRGIVQSGNTVVNGSIVGGDININGKTIKVTKDGMTVDGEFTQFGAERVINIVVQGNVETLKVDTGSIVVEGNAGDIKLDTGNIDVKGNVNGSVKVDTGNVSRR